MADGNSGGLSMWPFVSSTHGFTQPTVKSAKRKGVCWTIEREIVLTGLKAGKVLGRAVLVPNRE